MQLLSFPFAIIALSTVALSVGCVASDDKGTDDTSTQTTDTGAAIVDDDSDGVAVDDDCDDTDANLGAVSDDGDCDGALTADDCDDGDVNLGAVSDDGDCDGALTADDCDDGDAAINPGAIDELLADMDCVEGISDNSLALAGYSFVGENSGDGAGFSVSSAGDVDGDDLDDILVGANANNDSAGKVYLILGASLGSTSAIDLSNADYSFVGENSGDGAGVSVSSAGDVDGDDLDDLLVGADGCDDYAGKVYLILGASLGITSEIELSDADYSFAGENNYDSVGQSVSSAGDVDADGLDDLLMGSYGNDGAGKVYLILGASLGITSEIDLSNADYSFVGQYNVDYAGFSVSNAGDVDGDGLDDLLVGAQNNDDGGSSAGKTYLILGASLGVSSEIDLYYADHSFVGENNYDRSGVSVSSAGDVDGDGLDDLLVGADDNGDSGSGAGKAYLILSGL